ncbi:glycosyl hydrolase family 18 protein [Coprobacter secundus]|jgi:glycosyl hydrolases family 18|uniref:glycosyl hydrolase family 18 protein n=1 Tax=Coprobacter secundus TaxID=1501392 RepID=UPI000574C6C6|nr:glycosyl hydrolase family 18 protein [Coprobacter secundus]KHM47817.1 hypothetical protein PU94_06780 [Coprobacter secundus]
MKRNLFLCFLCLFCIITTATAQLSGNKGFKLNVNSNDAYLDCGDITQLNNTSAYTIEAWVNVNLDDLADRFIIFKKEQSDERNRIKVQVEKNGQIYVMQASNDGAYAQTSAGAYPKSGWHHIALVYDGTKTSTDEGVIILYIDGIKQSFSNAFFKQKTATIDANFVIGSPSIASYDEIRIWNKSLSAETISKWKSYKVLDSHPDKDALVAYYDFQNVTGATVPDLKGSYPATFKTSEAEIQDIDLKIFEEVGEMTIESAMVSQNTGNAYVKEENIQLLTLKINTVGAGELYLSGLDFSLDGTTKLSDIISVNVYYAGNKAQISDDSFTMNYQALRPGSTGKIELRDGENSEKQLLSVGNNFFIVAIRLKPTATDMNKLDGQITKLYFDNGNEMTPQDPSPSGDMTIRQIYTLNQEAYTQKCAAFNNQIVFGWFPWFSVNTIDKVDWKGLTHISPIGFEIDKGNYVPTFEDKGIDLKWPWIDFINDAHKNGVKVIAAITGNVRDGGNTQFYVDLFSDSQKMRAAAAAIAQFVDKYNLDGINMDIEEFYNTIPNHGAKYNELIKYINEELENINPDFELSVATYPGNEEGAWDFPGMLKYSDFLTIMMYNIGTTFTCPLPNAKERIQKYWLDINIPASNLVIAWPYYGNLFKDGNNVGTATLGNIPMYSKDNNITWDESAQCNIYKYNEDGANMTAYVEDIKSLGLKYDYTKQGGFKGIGIWALGQDAGMESQAYALIREYFDTTYEGSSIEKNDISGNISIYPIPVQNKLNIRTTHNSAILVKIYNSTGQLVINKTLASTYEYIDVNNLASGYYIIQVQTDTDTKTFRVIKK